MGIRGAVGLFWHFFGADRQAYSGVVQHVANVAVSLFCILCASAHTPAFLCTAVCP